jgi:hypothetical protein
VEVVSSTPDNQMLITQQGMTLTEVQTRYATNVLELFKSPGTPPPDLQIVLLGGKWDRGDFVEEITHPQSAPLTVVARYLVFLRRIEAGVYKPATADSNSFLKLGLKAFTSEGNSPLVATLGRESADDILTHLRAMKGAR